MVEYYNKGFSSLKPRLQYQFQFVQRVGGGFHNFMASLHLALSYHDLVVSQQHFCATRTVSTFEFVIFWPHPLPFRLETRSQHI